MMAEPGPRREPGPLARALGEAVNSAVARFPWSWRHFSGPARRFFDSVAVGWDEGVRSDSKNLRARSPGGQPRPLPETIPRSASQKVNNHSVELVRALARRPMTTAPQNAQLRVRKSFVRSSCPRYRHHAVAFAVNQEGWHSYFAQAFREIGFQPAPPHLALAKRAERLSRCRLVQKATGFIDEFVAHHPRIANHSTQPKTQRAPAPA